MSSLPESTPVDLSFPVQCRLKKPAEFQQVYQHQQRAGDQHLLVFARPNALEWTRIGLSVSRKQGKAVLRNRKKRLLREAFRLSRHQLPTGYDLVLIPRAGVDSSLKDYQKSLKYLVRKLVQRLAGQVHES